MCFFILQPIGEVKLMAINAFGLSLDLDMCRLHIDDDPDVAHIPREAKILSLIKENPFDCSL